MNIKNVDGQYDTKINEKQLFIADVLYIWNETNNCLSVQNVYTF